MVIILQIPQYSENHMVGTLPQRKAFLQRLEIEPHRFCYTDQATIW